MQAEPQAEHRWLERLVGDWTYEAEAIEPGKPPQRATGSESVRTLNGLWYIAEGEGEMPGGGPATTLMALGYDPARVLHRHRIGNPGKLASYKDVIEFRSDDHRLLSSWAQDARGEWHRFMTAEYRRVK